MTIRRKDEKGTTKPKCRMRLILERLGIGLFVARTPPLPTGLMGSVFSFICWCGCLRVFRDRDNKFSRKHQDIMQRYLPSFVFETKSTATHQQIVSSYWDTVFKTQETARTSSEVKTLYQQTNTKITVLYDIFYSLLEDQSPELKHVFRSSMQVRGKVLVHISIGMRSMLSCDNMMDRIRALTQTHRRFGVKIEYYNAVGQALIRALEATSDEHWSAEVKDAWERLFSHSSVILIADQLKTEKKTEHQEATRLHWAGSAKPLHRSSLLAALGDPRRNSKVLSGQVYEVQPKHSIRELTQSTTIATD